MATTLQLPMLFYIEDNGFGISVSSKLQTPGGNIAANLRSFAGLTIIEGDGTDPAEAAELTARAVSRVRDERAPVLLRLTVPRLSRPLGPGHAGLQIAGSGGLERARDPLRKIAGISGAERYVASPSGRSLPRGPAATLRLRLQGRWRGRCRIRSRSRAMCFRKSEPMGRVSVQEQGGLAPDGHVFPRASARARIRRARAST